MHCYITIASLVQIVRWSSVHPSAAPYMVYSIFLFQACNPSRLLSAAFLFSSVTSLGGGGFFVGGGVPVGAIHLRVRRRRALIFRNAKQVVGGSIFCASSGLFGTALVSRYYMLLSVYVCKYEHT